MPERSDKRADERLPAKASIIFSSFSNKNWHENPSVTLNLSAGGMCFEARHSVKPGDSGTLQAISLFQKQLRYGGRQSGVGTNRNVAV